MYRLEEIIKYVGIVVLVAFLFTRACSPANKDWVQERAEEKWKEQGFEVVGYLGFQWGWFGYGPYGGAKVWHLLEKDGNGITYSGYLKRWGDELHVYSVSAIDAIKP
jgi:hypothetical protein